MKVAEQQKAPEKQGLKGIQTWTYPKPAEHAALSAYAEQEDRTLGNAIIHLAMKQLKQESAA